MFRGSFWFARFSCFVHVFALCFLSQEYVSHAMAWKAVAEDWLLCSRNEPKVYEFLSFLKEKHTR